MSKSWEDLSSEGWVRHESDGQFMFYERPNSKRKIRRKRDLNSKEKAEIGDILFPGKRRREQILDISDHESGEQSINDHGSIHHDDVIMDDVPEVSESVTVSNEVWLINCTFGGVNTKKTFKNR